MWTMHGRRNKKKITLVILVEKNSQLEKYVENQKKVVKFDIFMTKINFKILFTSFWRMQQNLCHSLNGKTTTATYSVYVFSSCLV